jgi:hypothetical protein
MFFIPPAVSMHTLTPPAEVSASHYAVPSRYANAQCSEIPHSDHDFAGVSVKSVTGDQNELSPLPQVNFTVPALTPSQKPEFPRDFTPRVKVQPRALGQPHRSPSKMPGR